MADNVLDMSLDGIAPEEKIYPLNFVCQYVSECKDRLVAEETQTVSSVMALRNRIDGILEEAQTWGGMLQLSEEERAFHDSIVSKERALRDECDALITRMTEKDLIFEDMNNLLEQTEPLIGELVFRDSLTVAYNRFFFISRIEELLAECDPQRGFSLPSWISTISKASTADSDMNSAMRCSNGSACTWKSSSRNSIPRFWSVWAATNSSS